jgi:hypothetical protein
MPTIPATATITIRNNPSLIGRVHDSLSSVGGGSASRWASACFLKHDARETAPFYHKQWLSRRSRVDAYCSRTPGESSVRCGDPGVAASPPPGSPRSAVSRKPIGVCEFWSARASPGATPTIGTLGFALAKNPAARSAVGTAPIPPQRRASATPSSGAQSDTCSR